MDRRLLLVGDEENTLVGTRRYFRAVGFDVDCAREREDAEALPRHMRYEGVALDLDLPPAHGADGLDVIGTVREDCPSERVTIWSVSGRPERRLEAPRFGAGAYLRKPRPLARVPATIETLLGGRIG